MLYLDFASLLHEKWPCGEAQRNSTINIQFDGIILLIFLLSILSSYIRRIHYQ